jgi:hypothetical protein
MLGLYQTRLGMWFTPAWLWAGAILIGVAGSVQAEDGKTRVNPYDKKPFTFKEPVPKKRTLLCMWREGGAVGYCPVGPSTPIGASCECIQTIERAVTKHRGTVIAQQ